MIEDPNKSSLVEEAADRIRSHVGDAAEKLKGVGGQASSTAQMASDKTSDLLGSAKDSVKSMASGAGDKANNVFEDQKAVGAKKIKGISGAIRRAADELQGELPPAATYIRRAADEIDSMTDAFQRRDVRQILSDVQGFAKRQPAAFLGATVLGGFAVMRLLRTPTTTHETTNAQPIDASHSLVVPGSLPGVGPVKSGISDGGGVASKDVGFGTASGGTARDLGIGRS